MTNNAEQKNKKFIAEFGDIKITSKEYFVDSKIKKIDIPNIIGMLIKKTLDLVDTDPSNNNARFSKDETLLIDTFISDMKKTISTFMDFLDYDNNQIVELINTNRDGLGNDLGEFWDDINEVLLDHIKAGDIDVADKVFMTVSKMFVYMNSEQFTETREDIIQFSNNVKVAYNSFKALKNINHKKYFETRLDDMITFIITFCVILVPVLNYIQTNLLLKDSKSFTIKNDELNLIITNAYGDKLEFVLEMVNKLTVSLLKALETSNWSKIKQKLCCCISDANNELN